MSNDLIIAQPATIALSAHHGVETSVFVNTLRSVAMPKDHTVAEVVSCIVVAQEHGLNPLTKEIYFMRTKAGSIQPIVSVDGWIKKCNEHHQFDGLDIELDWTSEVNTRTLLGGTIQIFRKDRSRPISIYEDFAECRNAGGPVWKTSPTRMMRNRLICQGARIAFGFAGIMAPDEFAALESGTPSRARGRSFIMAALPDLDQTPLVPTASEASQAADDDEHAAFFSAPDDRLADEDGFLSKLEEDVLIAAGDVELLAEITDHNAQLVRRLSPAARVRAAQIIQQGAAE